jgi:hypothetical protein
LEEWEYEELEEGAHQEEGEEGGSTSLAAQQAAELARRAAGMQYVYRTPQGVVYGFWQCVPLG